VLTRIIRTQEELQFDVAREDRENVRADSLRAKNHPGRILSASDSKIRRILQRWGADDKTPGPKQTEIP
jgi:hypothetical protein